MRSQKIIKNNNIKNNINQLEKNKVKVDNFKECHK